MFQQANVCQCKVSATRGMADCSPCYTPLCVMHIDDDNDDVNYHGSIVLLNNSVKLYMHVRRTLLLATRGKSCAICHLTVVPDFVLYGSVNIFASVFNISTNFKSILHRVGLLQFTNLNKEPRVRPIGSAGG